MQESEQNQITQPDNSHEATPSTTSESPKPEKRPLSIWRRMFRILLVLLIIFGSGALLVIYTLYIPMRVQLSTAETRIEQLTNENKTELGAANETIDRLSLIEEKYDDTRIELDQLHLQNLLLKTRIDILTAKLALVAKEPKQAMQALNETGNRIADLKKLVTSDQQKEVENLSKRLELVLEEIEDDSFAAISDLEVMLGILDNLET